jgi:hypothetical protein
LSGVSATGSVGNLSPAVDVALSGVSGAGQVGSVAVQQDASPAGDDRNRRQRRIRRKYLIDGREHMLNEAELVEAVAIKKIAPEAVKVSPEIVPRRIDVSQPVEALQSINAQAAQVVSDYAGWQSLRDAMNQAHYTALMQRIQHKQRLLDDDEAIAALLL